MELMELLEKGDVETFNGQRPEGRIDLFAADLAEKPLAGVDLSRANLDKSDFTEADLTDSTLLGTSMTGIDGSGMKLSHTLAIKLRAKRAWLDEADLSEGDFTRGDFKEAVLEKSVATGAVFAGARFIEANCKGALWTDADLVEANVHKADFTGADLRRADLSECSGQETVFDGANLEGIVAAHARLASSSWKGATLVGARLLGANLAGADLSEADLSMADLTGANLTGATLTGATLRGTVFADAVLDDVDFAGLELTGVDLSGVDVTPLSLSEEQKQQAGNVGVDVPEDAAVFAKKALAATAGGGTAVIWENVDGEEQSSLRFAVFTGKKAIRGVVPVPADKALARTIGPDGDGWQVAVLRDRPGGVALVCYRIEPDGTVSGATSSPLGYEPMVWPVLGEDAKGPILWGLARRGPTLAVHRPGEEGYAIVYSDRVPTARGFLGKHHPVITCKGEVVQAATARSAGRPKRTPEGFPGRLGSAAPVGDRVFCCWVVDRVGDTAGGLRYSWLEKRGAPETNPLTIVDAVMSLDVFGREEEAWVAWVELTAEGGRAFRVNLPDGKLTPLAPDVDAARVCLAKGGDGVPDVVITTTDGHLVRVGPRGGLQTLT